MAFALIAGSASTSAADSSASEYAVKAAIVYKIAKFVSWPEDSSAANTDSLTICLPKSDPIGPAMEALAGKTVHGKAIEIRRFEDSATLSDDCAILFISKSATLRRPAVLSHVANAPVLTIGDSDNFADIGGIVMLEVANNHVQFAINMNASDRAGLGISAQLLQLAKLLR